MKKTKETETVLPKENKMGYEKVPKLLFSVSLPIIISMIVQALYNVVDSVFVAAYDNIAGTGALTAAFPIQNLMIATAVGLGVGVNALLSRSLGEKKFDKADHVAGQGFFLSFCGYLIFLVFGIFLTRPFVVSQVGSEGLLYSYSVDYISVVTIGSFSVFLQVLTERLLQATGKSVYSMITQATGAIVNIILDPIMIFGYCGMPEMGVKGAAIATVIGQTVAAALGIFFNLKYNPEIRLKLRNFIPHLPLLRQILAIGVPAICMQAIGSVMTYSMNKILFAFSEEALNVFGLYFKLQSFVFMPVFGLNNGMIPIISYNYGAKKKDRVYATFKLASFCAIGYMLTGFAVFQTVPHLLLGIFNASETMLAIGVPALRIISICFVLAGFAVIASAVCQALGKSVYSLIISIGRQLAVLVPVAYLLSLLGKVTYVWWAFPIAEGISLVLSILFLLRALSLAFGKKASENP